MLDYIIIGLISGLGVFLTFFVISFLALSAISACVHLAARIGHSLFVGKTVGYKEQAVQS
jgi:hypothetical protein